MNNVIASLLLYVAWILALSMLQGRRLVRVKYPRRFSCRIVDGKSYDERYF